MKASIGYSILAGAALGLAAAGAPALEIDPHVPPQVDIGGRALATAGALRTRHDDGTRDRASALDIADSSLLFGFSKYLFDGGRYGFAVIGVKVPEDDTDLRDDLYLHELHAGVGGRNYEIKLGRSRLPNTLLAFPTLRDDDLLEFTHVGNAFSHAHAEEYQVFGGLVSGTWFWPAPRLAANAALTARTETDTAGVRVASDDFNGGSLTVAYDVPEDIKFDRGLRYAALGWDRQRVRLPGDPHRDAWLAGLAVNLNSNPEATWNLDLQGIVSRGVAVPDLGSGLDRARAESRALAAALRYGHRPHLQTRWQAALTVGWKDYPGFDAARAWAIAPSYAYRLGSGVDFVAQYVYRDHADGLATATGVQREQRVHAGLSFAFDYTLNKHVGRRDSILFLEHDMLDIGPIGGGH
jgi:hypothetical protein